MKKLHGLKKKELEAVKEFCTGFERSKVADNRLCAES